VTQTPHITFRPFDPPEFFVLYNPRGERIEVPLGEHIDLPDVAEKILNSRAQSQPGAPVPADPVRKPRKPRKPTLVSVAKQANKAAIPVARYEVKPDGTVVVVTGELEQQQGNEVDDWIAKHADKTQRH
jgi:hypothetical protein